MAGLYLHIPFCKQACYYCDFHFSTSLAGRTHLIEALAKEMQFQRNYLEGETIETIYFGGGTPSILTRAELELIMQTVRREFTIDKAAEITVEVNPDDLTLEKLETLRQLGVNRLSIGIQSFSNQVLGFFNRAHSVQDVIESFSRAREVGFSNISIDLIYGIPDQNKDAWARELRQAIELTPEHISAYSLTIEDNTVFGRWSAAKKFKAAEEEVVAEQFELLMTELEKAGYEHYEISNFSKPGFHSRHNSSYWRQKKYLGIGPSAHSFNGDSRQFNIRNNNLYVKALEENRIPFEIETLTPANKINEYLLTTLRTSWGCDLRFLEEKLNYPLLKEQGVYVSQLVEDKMAEQIATYLRLTPKGKLLADKIASDLFVNDDIKLANFRP